MRLASGRVLRSYFEYYARSRTHLSLGKDATIPRPIQPPQMGRVVELREVGGLRHRYERRAALTELDAIPFAGLSCLTRKFVTTMYTLPGSRTIKVQHTWVFRAPSHIKSFSR